ncbi:AT-rich interactive domain-containing protein 4A [Gadus chalcogrammus]|uniref:AT-rich interactive domain-containing protein 4A n=1 Tax=Gadus chalcogrammus TaxID=1042646 RepID=UPI0024C42027|nr:AT-rich interactive domain-containing protein 4A [Gadus chalcogrammus]
MRIKASSWTTSNSLKMKAVDEPAYLTVGTDVSAKYRGAFCEAKIKTVKRLVKVKVVLKGESTSQVVQDDQVKGALRIGSTVEVRTNEGPSTQAVISKLTDASLYTVVFDDGDEKTLRRTSLCLKGERHFAESETLDQLPLTNPEHFGTPVIGKKSNRGGRRSSQPVADEEHHSSSSEEDEEDRRRLKDDILGKVCCVQDTSDRSGWYLALVVSPSCSDEMMVKKDQCLIRSFSDSKFSTVSRKDVHVVAADAITRPEFSCRKGHKAAVSFLRSQEVPELWKMDMSQILDSSSSDEDEEVGGREKDSEEEEEGKKKRNIKEEPEEEADPEERDHFLQQLYKFMEDRGTPINKPPVLGYKDLNLFKLFRLVFQLGGCHKIESGTVWKQVYVDLGIPVLNSAASYNVKTAYRKYLYGFEEYCRSASITFRTIHHNNPRPPSALASPAPEEAEPKDPGPIRVQAAVEKEEPESDGERGGGGGGGGGGGLRRSLPSPRGRRRWPGKSDRRDSISQMERDRLKEERGDGLSRMERDRQERGDGLSRMERDRLKEERGDGLSRMERDRLKEERSGETSGEEQREGERVPPRRRSHRRHDDSDKESGEDEEEEEEEEDEDEDVERRRERGEGEEGDEDEDSLMGTKVRVKYGRGKSQKIYEANIKKMDSDDGDQIYLVHYYGWNVRYDEWVKADRIIWPVDKGATKRRTRKKLKNKEDGDRGGEEEKGLMKPGSGRRGRPQTRTPPSTSSVRSFSKTPSSDGQGRRNESSPTTANGDETPRRRNRMSGVYDSDRPSYEDSGNSSEDSGSEDAPPHLREEVDLNEEEEEGPKAEAELKEEEPEEELDLKEDTALSGEGLKEEAELSGSDVLPPAGNTAVATATVEPATAAATPCPSVPQEQEDRGQSERKEPQRGEEPESGGAMSPSHNKMSPSHNKMSPSHNKMSPSHNKMSPSRKMSPSNLKMSPSHNKMSPSHKISPSHLKMSPCLPDKQLDLSLEASPKPKGRRSSAKEIGAETPPRAPPTSSMTPPSSSLTPPTSSMTPPTSSMTPPTSSMTPPTSSMTPPTSSMTPPTSSMTSPTSLKTPPISSMTPPTSSMTPPTISMTSPTRPITPPTCTMTTPNSSTTPPSHTMTPPPCPMTTPSHTRSPPSSRMTPPMSSMTPPTTAVSPPTSAVTSPKNTRILPPAAVATPTKVMAPPSNHTTPPTHAVAPPTHAVTTPTGAVTHASQLALSPLRGGLLKRQDEPMVVLHCLPAQHLPPEPPPSLDSDTDSAPEDDSLGPDDDGLALWGGNMVNMAKRKALEQPGADKKVRLEQPPQDGPRHVTPRLPHLQAQTPPRAAPVLAQTPPRPAQTPPRPAHILPQTPSRPAHVLPKTPPRPAHILAQVAVVPPSEARARGAEWREEQAPPPPAARGAVLHPAPRPGPTEQLLHPQAQQSLSIQHRQGPPAQQGPPTAQLHQQAQPQQSAAPEEMGPQMDPEALVCHEVDLDDLDEKEKAPPSGKLLYQSPVPAPPPPPAPPTADQPRLQEEGLEDQPNLSPYEGKDRGQKRLLDGNQNPSAKKAKRSQKSTDAGGKTDRNGTAQSSDSEDPSAPDPPLLPDQTKLCTPVKQALSRAGKPSRSPQMSSPHRTYKWSFQLDELDRMSSSERVSFLQDKLQEIRKYYLSLKSEVASIDRRRKRLKKKEREVSNTTVSTSSGSEGMTPPQSSVAVECR